MNKAGNFVTAAFIEYCTPLIGSNLPKIGKLRSPSVAKSFVLKEAGKSGGTK